MSIGFRSLLGVQQYTIGIRNQRAEVLASNLANADTPGYKARDIDFSLAFQNAAHVSTLKNKDAPEMVVTDTKHMTESAIDDDPEKEVKFRLPYQADTGNGNTVEISTERMKYVNNTMEYQASLQFLNGRIAKLKQALKTNA